MIQNRGDVNEYFTLSLENAITISFMLFPLNQSYTTMKIMHLVIIIVVYISFTDHTALGCAQVMEFNLNLGTGGDTGVDRKFHLISQMSDFSK